MQPTLMVLNALPVQHGLAMQEMTLEELNSFVSTNAMGGIDAWNDGPCNSPGCGGYPGGAGWGGDGGWGGAGFGGSFGGGGLGGYGGGWGGGMGGGFGW